MGKQFGSVFLILVVVAAALYIVMSRPIKLGLDLQGGTQLTLQASPTEQVKEITPEVMQGLVAVVEQRINGLGVSEPLIQISGQDQLFVQLAGVTDPDRAIEILGDTAQLDFRKQRIATEIPRDEQGKLIGGDHPEKIFEPIELNGSMLVNAFPQPDSSQPGSIWQIAIEFNAEGAEKYAQVTKDLAGTGRTLGIFLDKELLIAPIVPAEFARAGITGGQTVITGSFDVNTATDLAIKLKAGALPVPVTVIENRTVGATLGAESIRTSLLAGIGGICLVFIFMLGYYKLPGLMANFALLVYSLCTFALFQLMGVTMSLPGIAGFILSIGMAVDANVLIFERMKEELRAGKSLYKSIDAGFSRAFSSILDSNVTTLLACGVLFWLGVGLIKGFALTLALGIIVSFFSALTCTRTFLLLLVSIPALRGNLSLYGVKPEPAR